MAPPLNLLIDRARHEDPERRLGLLLLLAAAAAAARLAWDCLGAEEISLSV